MSGPGIEEARRLLVPLRDFFSALFFALFGLSIDPGDLPPVLVTAAVLAALTGATKFLSGWMIGRRADLDAKATNASRRSAPRSWRVLHRDRGYRRRERAGGVGPTGAAYVLMLAFVGPLLSRLSTSRSTV